MLGTIALWWCYVTGAAIALALTMLAWWLAVEVTLSRLGMTKILIEWQWDRLKRQRGRVLATKSEFPG